ncbi:MAG: STAS domain-containing protein [Planctomycetota bacterium]
MADIKPRISVVYRDGVAVGTLADEKILDEVDIKSVEESIMSLLEKSKPVKLLLDFSNVKFFSSAMLGVLIRVSKHVYEEHGRLKLCNINPRIIEIFKITRLDKVFSIEDDIDKALVDFR